MFGLKYTFIYGPSRRITAYEATTTVSLWPPDNDMCTRKENLALDMDLRINTLRDTELSAHVNDRSHPHIHLPYSPYTFRQLRAPNL